MKSFKKVAVTILAAVMMLLISTTVFAADSPVKTSFNASLTKKTVTYTGKMQILLERYAYSEIVGTFILI